MKTENLDINLFQDDYSKKKIVIIDTHWNSEIIKPMVEDCKKTLEEYKANVHVLSAVSYTHLTLPTIYSV